MKLLQDFLSANLDTFPKPGDLIVEGAETSGWHDAARAYLPAFTWAQLFPEAEGTKAAKALLDIEILVPGDQGRHTRRSPRSIVGRPRLYTLNTERLMAYKAC